ncbi:MAG: Rpn family recombination-promoting nuclease/putative transposase [Oscillospiraceae bacterium]|nr:Rpn family recombination-promoting nuclease/putative transposase [Oscillospiraceae bacterium]
MKKERTLISFDWALKSILRQKDNFDILEGFLSDLLDDNITILELLESESNKDNTIDKFNRVDLKAKDGKGREVIIEVQHDKEPDYLERVYYGVSKSLMDNMKEGYRYRNVKKIISVSIVYWKMLEQSYCIKGEMRFEDLTGGGREIKIGAERNVFAEYYFIQPEWFNDNIKTKLDEWVYLFKHSKVKGDIEATNIDKAKDKLDRLKMTDEERAAYESYKFNQTINEGVVQVKIDEAIEKNNEQIIQAMKANGMSDEEINKIISSANQ